MKVTFEELIEKIPTFNNEAGIGKSYVLELMEKTREATIKECVSKVTWYYNGPQEYIFNYADDIHTNKLELLNLDKSSIEL